MSFAFWPSADRARTVDETKHLDLADSLAHISDASCSAIPDVQVLLSPVVEKLRGGTRLSAQAFGDYFGLTEALLSDDFDAALVAAEHLANAQNRSSEMTVNHRGAPENADMDACIDRRLGNEASAFAPLPAQAAPDFPDLLKDGLKLLDEGFPDLAGEIRAIVHQVVLAQAPQGAEMEFDGASHYQFWGLLLLNPKHQPSRLAVAEALAHEAGHSFLFGLTRTEPLVLNPDDARYSSPLRTDPRPMDGIYHATFVSARMKLAMETLSQSSFLTQDERETAKKAARLDHDNFYMGLETIHTDGLLTDTGTAIMASTEEWMASSPN